MNENHSFVSHVTVTYYTYEVIIKRDQQNDHGVLSCVKNKLVEKYFMSASCFPKFVFLFIQVKLTKFG